MVFSSLPFLFLFLTVVLLVSHLLPFKFRNFFLLLANLVFYAYGEPVYVLIMIASILVNFFAGVLMDKQPTQSRRRAVLVVGIVLNLAALGVFKYAGLFVDTLRGIPAFSSLPEVNIALPIGISFYTFQTMTYPVDIYRGDAELPKNLVNFGTFVTLFPQLIAGPIIKYKDLADQMAFRTHSPEKFASGVQIFIVGLGKKVLLANNIGQLWDVYLATPGTELTTLGAWLGILAFSLQLYFDFSGYSDMAVGMGRMLGFQFLENFNYPYLAKSATEFWRRWHISLGSWFREYLYIPLGGNRVKAPRMVFNLFVVWACTGIWHGASWNFLIWGLYYFVIIVFERFFFSSVLDKLPGWVGHVYGLFIVMVGWALFAVEDFTAMGLYLKAMFGLGGTGLLDGTFLYYLRSYLPILIIAILAATPLAKNLWAKLSTRGRQVAVPVLMLAGLALATAYLVDGTYNPFLYFRF